MTKVLTVWDAKAEAYLTPMFAPTTAYALRMFEECANNPTHDFHKFAADFTLFEIGEWDEKAGEMVLYGTIVNIAMAHTLIKDTSNGTR